MAEWWWIVILVGGGGGDGGVWGGVAVGQFEIILDNALSHHFNTVVTTPQSSWVPEGMSWSENKSW